MKVEIEVLKREILERLRPLDPERVILFGSYAWGHPTEDSDIDLYIVTKDDFLPQSYEERRELVRRVSRALWDLRPRVPMDLIVHTRPMSERFFRNGGSMAREIQERGIVWYESGDLPGMVEIGGGRPSDDRADPGR
jgi:predicted nucleotidyltransferase